MKILTSLLLLLSLVALRAEADHKRVDYAALIGHAGCHAALTTSDEHSVLESFYSLGRNRLYIGTADDEVPAEYALIVLFHEIGHCLQAQEGMFDGRELILLELDADRRAADMACRMGLDGRRLTHDLLVWFHDRFGYDGDDDHGTLDERIGQSRLALSCTPTQAPFVRLV